MKKIRTKDGVITKEFDEIIIIYERMIFKFSHMCCNKLNKSQSNINMFEDFRQIGLMVLMDVYKKYDLNEGISFTTHLHRALNYSFIMLIRAEEAKKRKLDKPLLYLNENIGTDNSKELINIIQEENSNYSEEENELEEFLRENLSQEEKIILSVVLRRNIKRKISKKYKEPLMEYLESYNKKIGLRENCNLVEISNILNISRPTLNKRIDKLLVKIKSLTNSYINMKLYSKS